MRPISFPALAGDDFQITHPTSSAFNRLSLTHLAEIRPFNGLLQTCWGVIPVHVGQGLVKWVLSDPLVSWEVPTPAACVGELIPPVLRQSTEITTSHDQVIKSKQISYEASPQGEIQTTHHFIFKAPGQHQGVGAVVTAPMDAPDMWPVNACLAHLKG